jgi:K+-sensing histidine kinase KdpD
MINWSNWVYLGTGIALGMGLCWLFVRKSNATASTSPVMQQDQQILQQLQQVQLAYQMAWEMSQFKAGFLARTTHELRSPLNGLIGLHQLIYLLAANRNFPLQVLLPDPDIYVLADHRWLRQVLVNLADTAITQMEEGSICISSRVSPTTNSVNIWLDIPATALPWSESVDFIKSIEFVNSEDKLTQIGKENPTLSPGMKLLLNQTLLEAMGGKLQIVPSPSIKEVADEFTRLQVSIPLLIPEADFPPQYLEKQA